MQRARSHTTPPRPSSLALTPRSRGAYLVTRPDGRQEVHVITAAGTRAMPPFRIETGQRPASVVRAAEQFLNLVDPQPLQLVG